MTLKTDLSSPFIMRLKIKDIPILREKIAEEQGYLCKICSIDLKEATACLDHDHTTGAIRGVLCNNCNGIEGKIHNLARRAKRDNNVVYVLLSILNYWEIFNKSPRPELHPSHKTKDEKRATRNKKAKLRRLKKKHA